MILVIRKLFFVLELLRGGETIPVKRLAETTGFDKGSLCNLLKTLVDLGYAEKPAPGQYRLTGKFAALGAAVRREEEVERLSEQTAARLAKMTEESGVVTALRDGRVMILGQAQHPRRVMVRISHYRDLSLYRSASGKALLCALDDASVERIVDRMGLPEGDQWPRVGSRDEFLKGLNDLRTSDLIAMENPRSEVSSFAMAMKDAKGKVCAALGLSVPVFRMTPESRTRVEQCIRSCADEMEAALRAKGLQQADFMKGELQ